MVEHCETWLDLASAWQFDGQADYRTPKPCVRQAFAKYLECGIFAHGFERARCDDCGHDYFVAFCADIRQILDHIGVESEPPHITPARGPPLWDECDAQAGECSQIEPDWDLAPQPAPDFEVDQRIRW